MAAISVYNRQRRVRFDLGWLRKFAVVAMDVVESHTASFAHMEAVEVSIVSDKAISKVHEQFMGIAGPTDVISFHHGEIVVSAGTAAANAAEFHQPLEIELARYIVHGLLHLHGYEDDTASAALEMRRAQERLLKIALAAL